MTELEKLTVEVEQKANTMTDMVLVQLLDKLTHILSTTDLLDSCEKHTVLQIRASIAAINLYRIMKRRQWFSTDGGWKDSLSVETDLEYFKAQWARSVSSDLYHKAICTCGLTRKERLLTRKEIEYVGREREQGRGCSVE